MGLDMESCDAGPSFLCGMQQPDPVFVNVETRRDAIEAAAQQPRPGVRVDSISYYTMVLADYSRKLSELQISASAIAESGSREKAAKHWIDRAMAGAEFMSNQIMEDSMQENSLMAPSDSYPFSADKPAEHMTSKYGSFSFSVGSSSDKNCRLLEKDSVTDRADKVGFFYQLL